MSFHTGSKEKSFLPGPWPEHPSLPWGAGLPHSGTWCSSRAGSPGAGCSGPCLTGVRASPRTETPQLLWAMWSRLWPPFEWKKSGFLMLTQFPVSACCLWSSDWEPVRRDLHLSFPHQGRCIHSHTWARLPWAFSSPGCVVLPLSASPHFIVFPHTVWNYPRWHTNTTSPSHL